MTLEEAEYFRMKGLVALQLILLFMKKKGVTLSDGEYDELRNAAGEILNSFFEFALVIERSTIRGELQELKEKQIKKGGKE